MKKLKTFKNIKIFIKQYQNINTYLKIKFILKQKLTAHASLVLLKAYLFFIKNMTISSNLAPHFGVKNVLD